ncbi:MAG: hypothetical protein RL322_1264, partial [Pseudomonadota bacterium]
MNRPVRKSAKQRSTHRRPDGAAVNPFMDGIDTDSHATARADRAVGNLTAGGGLAAAIERAMGAGPRNQPPKSARPRPFALEQRFMFDGAAVSDATETFAAVQAAETSESSALAESSSPRAVSFEITGPRAVSTDDPRLLSAQERAAQRIGQFMAREDAREQMFSLFSGELEQRDAAWDAAFDRLREDMANGRFRLQLSLRDDATLQGAYGAFAGSETSGVATIFLNADWIAAGARPEAIASVLIEEIGHAIDARINPVHDTAGDEGERFAYQLAVGEVAPWFVGADDDHATLMIEGRTVEVE